MAPGHIHSNGSSTNLPDKAEKLTFKENKVAYIKRGLKKFARIIWNSKKNQFLGNDGQDWTYISVFYVIFYGLLGGFTWSMIAVFMAVTGVDRRMPVYVGKESVLAATVVSPGMGVRPHLGTSSPSIVYSLENNAKFIENLNLFLKPYEGSSYSEIFTYLKDVNCSESQSYGYKSSSPCVLVKINNVFTWEPSDETKPTCVSNQTNTQKLNSTEKFVYIQCLTDDGVGVSYASKFNQATQSNSCYAGVPFTAYPFKNELNYAQPLVVVKLDLEPNIEYRVTCTAYAQNLVINSRLGYGTIEFKIRFNQ